MATKFSDIVRLRGGKPAYNIEEEKEGEWISFIPNHKFNDVLTTVIKAVRGNDIDIHKSFWINGTYGTGKSHASAVVAHLLADPVEKIREWVDYEFKSDKYAVLRQSIYKLREQKRLLTVKMYGLCSMSAITDLALVMQKGVMDALARNGISLSVQTDYESLISNIEGNLRLWEVIIDENAELEAIAPTPQKLISLLKNQNISAYHRAIDTLKGANFSATLDLSNLGKWLVEVQNALAASTEYNGLFIVWDEFTDVMNAFGAPILKEMQGVAEKFMNEENNSFICLVSHPSAFNNISHDEQKQTDGRYHRMDYNMGAVSAFKIMSRKFEVVDETTYNQLRYDYLGRIDDVVNRYVAGAVDEQTTREDLLNLFPLHPGTANLATYYATVIGSSSRSVFEFLGQNNAIKEFLDSEEHFKAGHAITADYLWDFVFHVFQEDVTNYGAVTERFNSHRLRVENMGEAYMAVFKAVLLLNAFNNMSGDDNRGLVTPSEENIKALFAGTQYEECIDMVLDWFNSDGVIQRAPGGLYSVQFSALPSQEIEEKKQNLRVTEYRFTHQVVKFGEEFAKAVSKKFAPKIIRPYSYGVFSDENNDSVLTSKIKNGKRGEKASDLYIAFLVPKNVEERSRLEQFANKMSDLALSEKDMANIFFVVIEEPLTDKDYERFIEYMAHYSSASAHGFVDQTTTHRKHASDLVKEYAERVARGNAKVYINGESVPMSMKHFSSTFNDVLCPKVFMFAPESLDILRKKAPQTFWANKTSKEIVRRVMFATTKSEVCDGMAQINPMKFLLQDALDDNMEWKPDVNPTHPLKAIYDFVNDKIKYANKTVPFNFMDKFDELTKPPYGLYNSFAAMGAMAYAMRPWVNKIFDQMGKPRDKNNLVEDITDLFKAWDSGKTNSKLVFKFQTPEEGKLCKALTSLFKLKAAALANYTDISSLKDARFAITNVYIPNKGYPLWSLKYASEEMWNNVPTGAKMTDEIRTLIDNVVKICNERELRNPALVNETLSLIDKNKYEADAILKCNEAYKDGFVNYLKRFETIKLQDSEVEDAITFINQNLQTAIGYWSEEEVANAIKDWRISTIPVAPANKRYEPVVEPAGNKFSGEPASTFMDGHQKRAALNKLKRERDAYSLRHILERLCESGNKEAIELIISSL